MSESTHRMDPTFYRSAAEAVAAPTRDSWPTSSRSTGPAEQPDALTVVDVDEASTTTGSVVGWADLPTRGDELHHFGWNACSQRAHARGPRHGRRRPAAALPAAARAAQLATSTSTTPSPTRARRGCTRRSRPQELAEQGRLLAPAHPALRPGRRLPDLPRRRRRRRRAGRHRAARPHHVRRAARLGDRPRAAVPGLRRLVAPQPEHADHQRVGHPVDDRGRHGARAAARPEVRPPAALLGPRRGPAPADASTSAPSTRWCWSCGPSHDPEATWGFVGVVVSTEDLSASVWRWHRDGDRRGRSDKVITIPAEPADPADLPPALQPFGAVPPLVTDIDLSVDDRMLYVSCWGTGELKQYDVSDPAHPREVGSVHLGGIVRRTAHPAAPGRAAGRRPADGRGQPRRPPRLRHQLALRRLGRPVLSRTASAPGWRRSTPTRRRRDDASTSGSSRTATTSAACARTRCGCRAATPRRTRTATADPWRSVTRSLGAAGSTVISRRASRPTPDRLSTRAGAAGQRGLREPRGAARPHVIRMISAAAAGGAWSRRPQDAAGRVRP